MTALVGGHAQVVARVVGVVQVDFVCKYDGHT
jgi:hypothetical protein